MQNFEFHIPTKIVFGRDTVDRVGQEAKALGRRLLLVYGKGSIRRSGLYDRVTEQLRREGLEIVEHGGVKSNPVLSHARAGVELAKKEKIDFILAVGGGSVIDESKAIAASVATGADAWDFYIDKAKIRAALPVMTVLTIPATGTEMNGGTVIINEETKQKYGFMDPHLYPRVSILDPALTFTIPPDYTAYSAVDAISHLVEKYFTCSDPRTPLQDRLVEGLVRTIMEATDAALADPRDYEARATFMWCASLAWNGLTAAGVGDAGVPAHMLEHPLSALYDIAHGAGLSITEPAWMSWAAGRGNPKVERFAREVFGVKGAGKGIAALKRWFDRIGSPTTLPKAGIPEADIPKIVPYARELAAHWGLKGYTDDVIEGIYRTCV
jgi:alcohol dehydrogenase YqhD (iron-dependent ADH family)